MPDQDDKTTMWNAPIMASAATMRSVERRKVTRLPQTGNLPTMPPTLTMKIMVELDTLILT